MSFMQSNGWYCQFLEEDLKTPLPRKLTFASAKRSWSWPNGLAVSAT